MSLLCWPLRRPPGRRTWAVAGLMAAKLGNLPEKLVTVLKCEPESPVALSDRKWCPAVCAVSHE